MTSSYLELLWKSIHELEIHQNSRKLTLVRIEARRVLNQRIDEAVFEGGLSMAEKADDERVLEKGR